MRLAVCELEDLAVGLGRAYDLGARRSALFRGRGGEVFAMDNACPHRNGPLADGMLIGSQVVCPLHGYRYEGQSGECDQPAACGITAYPAAVENGRVVVELPS